ncbi:MAG: hypothetical protein HGA22_04795 [Clostridiales bacterium]|nr:hypothetical protein [Clostridiales bacterium]
MSSIILKENETRTLEGTLELSSLTIAKNSGFSAPKGKNVTMTVDGVETAAEPGTYNGSIVLTLTSGLGKWKDDYRTALYVENGEIDKERSVLSAIQGGSYDGSKMENVKINSKGPSFGGVYIKDGKFEIKNLDMTAEGFGGDDMNGKGYSLFAGGKAEVNIDGLRIRNHGLTRSAFLAADDAKVVIKNADIETTGANDEEQAALAKFIPGMISVPWVLGLYGNNRATNIVSRADVTYIDSSFKADRWGVLSTDGPAAPDAPGKHMLHLTAKNCNIEITGDSGYGTYCIGSGKNVFENCKFKIPDYAMVVANEIASSDFVDTTVDSGRFGILWHQNQGGVVKISNSTLNTGMTSFLVKACYPRIEVEKSVLNARNGVILQLMDSDDPGLGPKSITVDTNVAKKIESHDVTKINMQDAFLYNEPQKDFCTDLIATFKDMEISGDFYNAITNEASVGNVREAMPDMPEENRYNEELPPPMPPSFDSDDDFAPPPMPGNPASLYPINMALKFSGVALTGVISASTSHHKVTEITKHNRIELGQVTNKACPVVNNGVIAEFDAASKWTVIGDCYLSSLTLAKGTVINAPAGKKLRLTVNGIETAITDGSYKGNVVISLV